MSTSLKSHHIPQIDISPVCIANSLLYIHMYVRVSSSSSQTWHPLEGEEKDFTEEDRITQPLPLSQSLMSPVPVSHGHVPPWSTPMVNMDMMDMDNDNEDNDNDKEDNG